MFTCHPEGLVVMTSAPSTGCPGFKSWLSDTGDLNLHPRGYPARQVVLQGQSGSVTGTVKKCYWGSQVVLQGQSGSVTGTVR